MPAEKITAGETRQQNLNRHAEGLTNTHKTAKHSTPNNIEM
jgi:hypothetical protein